MTRRVLWIAGAALVVAALTAAVFLIRAGTADSGNWPIDWELTSSDNGVLFQFMQDFFAGRPLDWTFSPQVYVFPELPISFVGYLVSGGSVQVYYVVVAALNNALLFLSILATLRYLFPDERLATRVVRSAIACLPLVLPPLLGALPIVEFQLAPTYYIGAYLAIFLAPVLYLSKSRAARILVAIALVLTVASDPLTAVFVVPAAACVLVVQLIAGERRSAFFGILITVCSVLVALALHFWAFSGLQAVSPLNYVQPSQLGEKFAGVWQELAQPLGDPLTAVILVFGALAAIAVFVFALRRSSAAIRGRAPLERDVAALVYYWLVPMTTLVATIVLFIFSYLYLWPVLIAPLVIILVRLPRSWIPIVGLISAGALVISAVSVIAIERPAAPAVYVAYQSTQTQCLDAKLPPGMTAGYADYFDARRVELTATRPLRLNQIDYSGSTGYAWLTNKVTFVDPVGTFFYLGVTPDEPTIPRKVIEKNVGVADGSFTCPGGAVVLLYTDQTKVAAITKHYSLSH